MLTSTNAAALTWRGNNRRTKLKYHYVRDLVQDCTVNCEKIDTKDNCSDVMTKAVTAIIFKTLLPRLMGHSSQPVEVVVKMTNLASKYLRMKKWNYKMMISGMRTIMLNIFSMIEEEY